MIRKPNFKLNWKYALGELVLIFLGISLAIWFQNFNEERKKSNAEIEYLENLLADLRQDSATVDRYVVLAKWKYEDGQTVYKFIKNEIAEVDSSRVLNNIFFNGRNVQYIPYIPTYDELIASGNLNVIKNDVLRTRLRNLMNHAIKNEGFYIEEFKQRKVNYNDHIFKYFSADLMSEIWGAETDKENRSKVYELKDLSRYRMDWAGFVKDPLSLYHVEICMGVDRENIANQQSNLDGLSGLITTVRAELNSKK